MTYQIYQEGNFWVVEIYSNGVLVYRAVFDHYPSTQEINNLIASLQGVGPPPDVRIDEPKAHALLNAEIHTDTDEVTPQEGMLIVGKNYNGVYKWGGLSIGAAGTILRSDGTKPVWGSLPSHASSHVSDGSDPITGNLDANARVAVSVGGNNIGTRRRLNFVAGSNISISATDDANNERVNINISATAAGGLNVLAWFVLNPINANTWYVPFAANCTALTTLNTTAGRLYYIPFVLMRTYIMTGIAIEVTTASSGTSYLGIYDTDYTTFRPSTLIYGSGSLDTGSTGVKSVTGLSITLEGGKMYWAALCVATGTPTIRAVAVGGVSPILGIATGGTAWNTHYYQSATSLPSTAGANTNGTGTVPCIYFRFSHPS